MRALSRTLLAASVVGLVALGWMALRPSFTPRVEVAQVQRYSDGLPVAAADAVPAAILAATPAPYFLQDGETLDGVFESLGVASEDRLQLVELASSKVNVRRLRPGNVYQPYFDSGRMTRFDLEVDGQGELTLQGGPGRWSSSYRAYERSSQLMAVKGRLDSSFEGAMREAGAEATLAYKVAEVFQWDLDFNRDLRTGDEFEVVYERDYLDGQYRGLGDVVAAVYRGGNRELRAYRYGEDGGYYDPEGRPLEKMFLRSPMKYSRVTSRFSRRRFHPVLKRYRPHYGVDYGAPTGTPVHATATGTVISAGRNGGAGRMIKLRHPNDYQTAYLHLSGYARGVRAGARISQGQVIGYVGSSGLATGPHLDYRVQHRGKWIDPMSLNNLPADPIPMEQVDQFLVWRGLVDEALSSGQVDSQLLAAFTPSSTVEPAS